MAALLTILIVSGPNDEPLVKENVSLIKKLNPSSEYDIFIVDNGASADTPAGINGDVGAQILSGVPQDMTVLPMCRGSYQHSSALNQFIRTHPITTPYLLVLDPDFYIIRLEWISELTSCMEKRNLSFFGSVWNPRWFKKYRNFPSVHCLLINSRLVPLVSLNFMPDSMRFADKKIDKNEARLNKEVKRAQKLSKSGKGKRGFSRLLFQIKSMLMYAPGLCHAAYKHLVVNREMIASSLDTGYLIEKKYAHDANSKYELLTPVITNDTIPAFWNSWINKLIENFLPDKFCYLPKRKGYYTYDGFHFYGLPDLAKMQWEEFMWQGAPFAFHIRRQNKKGKTVESKDYEIELLKQVLKQIF